MSAHTKKSFVRFTIGLVGFSAATAAWAVPVTSDTWYEFGFFGPAGTPAFQGTGTVPVPGSTQVGVPAWTFTGAAEISLTDNFSQGDSFQLFDNGTLIGKTPKVAKSNDRDLPAIAPEAAMSDPSYSHGIFSVGPGTHSLTIKLDESPFLGGAGFFKITSGDSVPDGGSHLLLLGLGALALFCLSLRSRSV